MDSIKAILATKKDKKKGPNSLRAYWVQETCDFLGEQNFKKILGLTSHLPPLWIRDLLEVAKGFKANGPALWWKELKKSRSG